MKGLILKDLYNISHNAKSLFFTLIFLSICLIPSSGASGFAITTTIIFSMMTLTTFSLDERSKWAKYALIMPVTRKDYVKAKFVVNFIFSLAGTVIGSIIACIGEIVKGTFEPVTLLVCCGMGLCLGVFFGSLFIPLIIKWGTEQARMVSVVAVAVPSLLIYVLYMLLKVVFGVVFTDSLVIALLVATPVVVGLISYCSYLISVRLFKMQEF